MDTSTPAAATAAPAQQPQMIRHVRDTEYALLRAPHEAILRAFRRAQKVLERDIAVVAREVAAIGKGAGSVPADWQAGRAGELATRLAGLRAALEAARDEEDMLFERLRLRMEHLAEVDGHDESSSSDATTAGAGGGGSGTAAERWGRVRVDRVIVDYLLRQGFLESARRLAEDARLAELVDTDVFFGGRPVVAALADEHDCRAALRWCNENRSRLRKLGSDLEFRLRVQEYVELVRRDDRIGAIAYARRHLAPLARDGGGEMQAAFRHAMGVLAFASETRCARYADLFDAARWAEHVQAFKRDLFALNALPSQSMLGTTLQAGLAALKTRFCSGDDGQQEEEGGGGGKNVNCPTCTPELGELARPLPFAHHVHSALVCRISGDVMDEHNPPMAFPGGTCYSHHALQAMAAANGGTVTCPRSGIACKFSELQRVFIT